MFDLPSVQAAIQELGLDGWLLYDFRGLNVLARRIIGLTDAAMLSRRWFYLVPANGEPRKLVHRIEPHALDHLPGTAQSYLRWQDLEAGVTATYAEPFPGDPPVTAELVREHGLNDQEYARIRAMLGRTALLRLVNEIVEPIQRLLQPPASEDAAQAGHCQHEQQHQYENGQGNLD